MRGFAALLVLALLAVPLVGVGAGAGSPAAGTPPILITPLYPGPDEAISSQTPNISATYADSASPIVPADVYVIVDRLNVSTLPQVTATPTRVTYAVPSILKLSYGNHTVTVSVTDEAGNHASYSWGFNVTAGAGAVHPIIAVNPQALLFDIALASCVGLAGFGGAIFYLKQTRRFTFKKYFAIHPVRKEYLVLYVPLIVAFFVVLVGLLYVTNTPGLPTNAPDYVLILGIFVALTAYAVDARREKLRIRAYERAFAQFLFEMADATRGGIDPAKAVIELAKTQTNILRKPLRIAADAIRLGKPFEDVLQSMVARMKSPLISRYAGLVADASSVGGETSAVVYRAAKDMDDFIKIEVERNKQLTLPVSILYIAFAVLMAVLFALLFIAPSLGSINTSIFSPGGANPLSAAGGTGGTSAPHLPFSTLRERFFDLMIINSLGTGVIIGAFTEGKAQYGLLHSLALVAATTIAFAVIFPA